MVPNLCIRYPASGAERRKRNQCQEISRRTGMKEVATISGRTHCRHIAHNTVKYISCKVVKYPFPSLVPRLLPM